MYNIIKSYKQEEDANETDKTNVDNCIPWILRST